MLDPHTTIPEGDREAAYAALLKALARDEPEALRRAAATIDAQAAQRVRVAGAPAASLARAWLASAGNQDPTTPQLFTFTYPAHVYFEIVASGGPDVARRLATRAIRHLLGQDEPLGGVNGPLPAEPSLSNVAVWVGSTGTRTGDALELELMD